MVAEYSLITIINNRGPIVQAHELECTYKDKIYFIFNVECSIAKIIIYKLLQNTSNIYISDFSLIYKSNNNIINIRIVSNEHRQKHI